MLSQKKHKERHFFLELMKDIDVVDVGAFIMNLVKHRKVKLGTELKQITFWNRGIIF